ncbi:hypothetical protein B0H13DRAFT_2523871 [Mycena leptocephala]|nr:hypothetical protein B0H13DRAFT_2523871 [Mycena leptocephala]
MKTQERLSGFDQADYPALLFYHALQHAGSVKGGMEMKSTVRVRMNGTSVAREGSQIVLEEIGRKGAFANNVREFARWLGLKHFSQVTTIHFTDGQSFYDIVKILPRNDALVHCIRAYEHLRIMTGMHCMPISRMQRLQIFIKDYEYWSSRMSDRYDKNFDLFKQHATSHILEDIRRKGTMNHGSTRPGEGFKQEAAEAYKQTNFKMLPLSGMNRIDETQEAIARIRMAIDKYDKQREGNEQEEEAELDEIKEFDLILRDFSAEQFPDDRVSYEQQVQIRPFKCLHITYQSLEDWRGLRDILRCNPSFHGNARFDSVLFNSDSPGMSFARIFALLCCTLESKRQFDVALVRAFPQRKWKPWTEWAGCQVHKEVKSYSLLLTDYVIRGALLTPVNEGGKENICFLVDTVDADMFLRADKQ